jgi:hypothetical protein
LDRVLYPEKSLEEKESEIKNKISTHPDVKICISEKIVWGLKEKVLRRSEKCR